VSEGTPEKGKKRKAAQSGVLGSLPSTRPNRIGRRREPGESSPEPPAAPKRPPAKRRPPAAAKPAPATTPTTPATPKAASARKKTGATPATGAPPKATARKPARRRGTTNPEPQDRTEKGGPKAVRAGAPALEPGSEPPDRGPAPHQPPTGAELVTTVVQAAGELAQIGLTIGGQIVKRAVDRLPRP